MSDQNYNPDYAEDVIDWLKPDLFSYGQITKELRHVGTVAVLAQQKTEYATHTRWADLPSVRFSFTQRPIAAGWGLTPSVSLLDHTQDYLDSTNTIDTATTRDLQGTAGFGLSGPDYSLGPLGEGTASDQFGFSTDWSYYRDSLI